MAIERTRTPRPGEPPMGNGDPADRHPHLLDKGLLRVIMVKVNARMGFVPDPNATAERARAMMLEDGIRPGDNVLSRDIVRAKYPCGSGEE